MLFSGLPTPVHITNVRIHQREGGEGVIVTSHVRKSDDKDFVSQNDQTMVFLFSKWKMK